MTAASRSVLVVDDVAGIRLLVAAALADASTVVHQASRGEEALLVARDQNPDLIFLDLALPGMNGVEILSHLRADPETAGIPVVIVTALGHSELARQAIDAGANALIEKPFRPVQLRALLDEWTQARPPETAA